MATQALDPRKRLASGSAGLAAEELVRMLVASVRGDTCDFAGAEADAVEDEIILDLELDGSRYLLVRMPREERPRVQLSPREQEIVRMVAQGHPNKVIADVLCISSWTVCTYLRRIFAKLGVGSRAAMVARTMDCVAPGPAAAPRPPGKAPGPVRAGLVAR